MSSQNIFTTYDSSRLDHEWDELSSSSVVPATEVAIELYWIRIDRRIPKRTIHSIILVQAAVFQPLRSPLNEDAPANIAIVPNIHLMHIMLKLVLIFFWQIWSFQLGFAPFDFTFFFYYAKYSKKVIRVFVDHSLITLFSLFITTWHSVFSEVLLFS